MARLQYSAQTRKASSIFDAMPTRLPCELNNCAAGTQANGNHAATSTRAADTCAAVVVDLHHYLIPVQKRSVAADWSEEPRSAIGRAGLVHLAIRRSILVVVLLLATRVVRADPSFDLAQEKQATIRVEWLGSRDCRPAADVLDGVWRLIGRESKEVPGHELAVRAEVLAVPNGWSLTLSSTGPNGPAERRLIVPSCDELAEAAALVISLWIQPTSAEAVKARETRDSPAEFSTKRQLEKIEIEPPRGRTLAPRQVRVSLRSGRVGVARARNIHFRIALGGTVFSGAVPGWSFGIMGRAGVAIRAFHLDGLLLWLDPRQRWTIATQPIGGEFGLIAAGLRVAYPWQVSSGLNVQPAFWALAGRLHAESLGSISRSTPSNDGWGAAGLGLDAQLSFGPVSFALGGGNGLPLGRPKFFVGDKLLYQIPPVAWFGHLLVAVAFP